MRISLESFSGVEFDRMNTKAIITVIHGTWAPNAVWMSPSSPLCSALQDTLDRSGITVAFDNYVWSGSNSVSAREEAARDLRQQIRRNASKSPTALRFLIAHSHGGNIAVDAVCEDAVAEMLSGVITMSTPFVSCRRSNVRIIAGILGAAAGFIFGFVVTGCMCTLLFVTMSWLWQRTESSAFFRWPAVLGMVWVAAALRSVITWPLTITADFFETAWYWAERWQDRILQRFERRLKTPMPILCVRFGMDEALLALRVSRLFVQPLRFVTGLAAWVVAGAELLVLLAMGLKVIMPVGL